MEGSCSSHRLSRPPRDESSRHFPSMKHSLKESLHNLEPARFPKICFGAQYFLTTFGLCYMLNSSESPHNLEPARFPKICFGARYFLTTFGSCNMLNSSEASFPAYNIIARLPPGWSPH